MYLQCSGTGSLSTWPHLPGILHIARPIVTVSVDATESYNESLIITVYGVYNNDRRLTDDYNTQIVHIDAIVHWRL